MAEGFPSIHNELKIGYLNDHVDKFLQIYLNKFDIVIVEDQTFDIPNAVLRAIFQKFNWQNFFFLKLYLDHFRSIFMPFEIKFIQKK